MNIDNKMVPTFEGTLHQIGGSVGIIIRKPASDTTIAESYFIEITKEQSRHIEIAEGEWKLP